MLSLPLESLLAHPLNFARRFRIQAMGFGGRQDDDAINAPQKVRTRTGDPPYRVLLRIRQRWRQQHQEMEVPRRHFCAQLQRARFYRQHSERQCRRRDVFRR